MNLLEINFMKIVYRKMEQKLPFRKNNREKIVKRPQ